jgi:hypothetical protein
MRLAASVVLAGSLLVGVTACEFITPQDTTRINQVSDGVDATAGPVGVHNAMLITADGTAASLVATFVNNGSTSETVQLQYTTSAGPATQQVTVPGNGSVSVRPGGQQDVQLEDLKAPAGSLLPIYFSIGSTGQSVQVPVLANNLPGYETLTPTPTPTPSPTKTKRGSLLSPSPSVSATPAG